MDLELNHKWDRKSQLQVRFLFQVFQLLECLSHQKLWLFSVEMEHGVGNNSEIKLGIDILSYENISLYFIYDIYAYVYISLYHYFCQNWTHSWKLVDFFFLKQRLRYKRVLIFYMQPRKHILKYFHLHIFNNQVDFWIIPHLGFFIYLFIFFPFPLYLTGIKSHCTFFIHTLIHTGVMSKYNFMQIYLCGQTHCLLPRS